MAHQVHGEFFLIGADPDIGEGQDPVLHAHKPQGEALQAGGVEETQGKSFFTGIFLLEPDIGNGNAKCQDSMFKGCLVKRAAAK